MAEPEDQIEEEAVTGEFPEEDTTNATDTDVQRDDTDNVETDNVTKYESTDYDSVKPDGMLDDDDTKRVGNPHAIETKGKKKKKKKTRRERCGAKRRDYEGESLWRIYMESYVESRRMLERKEDAVPEPAISSDIPRLPRAEAIGKILPPYECFPLGGFQLEHQARTPVGLDRCNRTRIWRSMRSTRQPTSIFRGREKISRRRTVSGEWRGVWPCTTRDLAGELKTRLKEGRKKRRDTFPCDPETDHEDEPFLREQRSDFANRKELGHVRAPVTCPEPKVDLVDRAAGEHPGLVDGDYVIVELAREGDGKRVYANVVLRGLNGMHLPELGPLRERRDTWKFCYYQAIVALLAKTQLRYKYAWSANIDYIYDHAWTLYTHIGTINVKKKQRFDDVVVYNYKYSVEIELIQEMRDIPAVREVDFNYEESNLKRQITLRRKDPLRVRVELGCEKLTDPDYASVHRNVREIEEWFDKLATRYRNCIFRATRFSLGFWQDGLFWYLYNPYRCDEFGLWDDDGRACIVKFCSKDSLRRHLMILLLRAYAYDVPKSQDRSRIERDVFDVQIFHVTFHCCQLHNLKLLQRGAPRRVDECPSDSLDIGEGDDASDREEAEDDCGDARETPVWLKRLRVTWNRCAIANRKRRTVAKVAVVSGTKAKWHHYYVEESNRLFSLWGERHITDGMFDEANRGMQTYACYVVCAGMTRIMAPEYWSSKILDVIVMCGDRYYAYSKLEAEIKSSRSEYAHVGCWGKYLSNCFKIGETMFEARMLPSVCGTLYARSRECLWKTLERMFHEYHFGILTCENVCLGLFKFCGAYYMCDVNSFGPPLFQYGHGAVYLMRATSFHRFMTVLVLTVGSPERSRFSLNPIEILKVVEVGLAFDSHARTGGRRRRLGRIARATLTFDERKKRRKNEATKNRRSGTRSTSRDN